MYYNYWQFTASTQPITVINEELSPSVDSSISVLIFLLMIVISTMLLPIASLIIIILVLIGWAYWRKKISRANTQQRVSEYEMEGNPCYEASTVHSADGETTNQNIYECVH